MSVFDVRCSLLVVCWLLFVVCGLLCFDDDVCYVCLFVVIGVYCMLFAIRCVSPDVYVLLLVVCCCLLLLVFVVCCLLRLFVVCCVFIAVGCLLFAVVGVCC